MGNLGLSWRLCREPLWSAIIESPRRKRISSQTAHIACRAKHHWTTTLLAATLARNDASVSGGCPAYGERTALAPSLRAGGVDTASSRTLSPGHHCRRGRRQGGQCCACSGQTPRWSRVSSWPCRLCRSGRAASGTNTGRSISHTLSRVTSGGGTASLRVAAESIACKDASLFATFSCP